MKNSCTGPAAFPLKDDPEARTICLTVGTAGHIDHGKTQLTTFLTGCNTDRLPEEKARGMTIDLGFATCILPSNRRVGIVDVPGHERFIHNMVAGATGIDVVLLVIAADDGVMPQTVEHFHILRLLGIKGGMVVITKTDLVEPARIDEVRTQAENLVRNSFLENAPIVPLSTKTGDGFDSFYTAFVDLVDKMTERDSNGPFRLNVERSFVIKGLGTVVSGIPVSGKVRTGDVLELLPSGRKVRVKGLQVYGRKADEGRSGECVAINLADIDHTEAGRGMILGAQGFFKPARFFDARFFSLPSLEKPLRPRTQIRLHIGTSDIPGHLVLPENTPLIPGEETYAQIQLRENAIAAPGDRFILRTLSPKTTLGGGYVVAPDERRLRRRDRAEWTTGLAEKDLMLDNLAHRIMQVFSATPGTPLTKSEIAKASLINEDALDIELPLLLENASLLLTDKNRYVSSVDVKSAEEQLLEIMTALHKGTPLSVGFSKKQIYISLSINRDILDMALKRLIESSRISQSTHGFYISDMAPALTGAQAAVAGKILKIFKDTGFASPRREDLPPLVGAPEVVIGKILEYLLQTRRLEDLGSGVILHADLIEESKRIILAHFEKSSELESGQFKNLLNSSRKYSIPVLEYWDRKGLTRRVGNIRTLKK